MPRRPVRRLYCNPFERRTWDAIQQWCHDPGHERYQRYGGRGVAVCDRWLDSFANFYQDMGARPPGAVLVRVDPAGPFSPENCRWARRKGPR